MKKLSFFFIALQAIVSTFAHSQTATMELSFTAENNSYWVQLDSIKVMNRTQGGDTLLFYPDTVLVLDYSVGITETRPGDDVFQVYQNCPNPVTENTTVLMYIPETDRVTIAITDILGRTVLQEERLLEKGFQSFRFVPGDGNIYFLVAHWRGYRSSIKIIHLSSGINSGSLEYLGSIQGTDQPRKEKSLQEFPFNLGDELLYIGYKDTLGSGILEIPQVSNAYTFQFATNIPCPGTPSVDYEGQVYSTIQIFSQCWLKENLNVGTMIPSFLWQPDDGIIEKYCYNNEPDSCTKYGGIYQWGEMMHYIIQNGAQGICPTGWHIPTNEDWKVLQGAVDTQYKIGDPEWDLVTMYYGTDAGTNLKTTSGWFQNPNGIGNGTDLYGFSALPAPSCDDWGNFTVPGDYAHWWSSTYFADFAPYRRLFSYCEGVWTDWDLIWKGFSVRCVKDLSTK